MLTQSTEYLRHVSFHSLSAIATWNSPSRMNSGNSFGLDCFGSRRIILRASADFIQVIINTKESETIAIALVRIGTAPANLVNVSHPRMNTRHGRPTAANCRHCRSDSGCSEDRCGITHNTGSGVADGVDWDIFMHVVGLPMSFVSLECTSKRH